MGKNNFEQSVANRPICVQHAGSAHEPTIFAAHLQLFLFDLVILHNICLKHLKKAMGLTINVYIQHACMDLGRLPRKEAAEKTTIKTSPLGPNMYTPARMHACMPGL